MKLGETRTAKCNRNIQNSKANRQKIKKKKKQKENYQTRKVENL